MDMKAATPVCLLLLVLFAFTGCATQGEVYSIDDRLASLERKNAELERDIGSLHQNVGMFSEGQDTEDQSLRNQTAGLRVSIDELRSDIQSLSGRLEETAYPLRQRIGALEEAERGRQDEMRDLRDQVTALTDQVQRIESYLSLDKEGASPVEPGREPVATTSPQGPGDTGDAVLDEQVYQAAKKAFDSGDYDAARKGFQDLLARFPKSENADNAQFWIGESYYREKWYEKAILEYQKVIEKYPKGNKVAASLLKQGFAFANLGDDANARLILKELIKKFPNTNESAIAQKKLQRL
jgi:tol-pal system protein YbgF